MKKIFIIDQGKGRMANQLWSAVSVYAYCLEKKYCYLNAAFDYEHEFDLPKDPLWFRILFLKGVRRNKLFIKLRLYRYYLKLIRSIFCSSMVWSKDGVPFYLPPTNTNDNEQRAILENIEKSPGNLFFNNWLFRNPEGLKKYREQIRARFTPRKQTMDNAEAVIGRARQMANHVVGVHIRQGDYRTLPEWRSRFYISPAEAKTTLQDYLSRANKTSADTVFIIASDEKIDASIFTGLQVIMASGTALEDLLTLSLTDTIIGSNSTYGAFAAYYGDIPVITLEKTMDWSAIGTKGFNYHNRCTNVHP